LCPEIIFAHRAGPDGLVVAVHPKRWGDGERGGAMSDQTELIAALITLLRDPEIKVHGPARHKLLEMRKYILPALKAARRVERNAEALARIEGVIHCVHALEIDDDLEEFARQDDAHLDLEAGCLLLARVAYPDLQSSAVASPLDTMAEELGRRLVGVGEPVAQIEALSRYLFIDRGFHGHHVGCDDPNHSFLNKVLERRKGLPIALGVVTVLVARRLGLPIVGVGMPGHYIVKYVLDDGDDILIDPWAGGAVITRGHCAELLGSWGVVLEDDHLGTTSDRATLQRMCRNLIKPFFQLHDHQRLGHVVRFLHILEEGGGHSPW
jgi:regulator of sirC expression with transglutaminase-like and TPR domain